MSIYECLCIKSSLGFSGYFYIMRKHLLTAFFLFIARNIYLKEEAYSNFPTGQYYAQFNTTSR